MLGASGTTGTIARAVTISSTTPYADRRLAAQDEVAIEVGADPLGGLAGGGDEDVDHPLAHLDGLAHLDLHVDRLALHPAVRLVQQHPGVRQRGAHARRAGGEQHAGGRGGLADAGGGDRRAHERHRVVDGEHADHVAARRVDVEVDRLVGVLRLEEQQLGHDEVGDLVVDRRAEEHDPLAEQPRVDVVGTLAAGVLSMTVGTSMVPPSCAHHGDAQLFGCV